MSSAMNARMIAQFGARGGAVTPAGGWDIANATFNQSLDISLQDNSPHGLTFSPDGTKMYMSGNQNDSTYEYTLGTAWNISTASYVQAAAVHAGADPPTDVRFKPDGTVMFTITSFGDVIAEYPLGTPWDLSTVGTTSSQSITDQDTAPRGFYWKPDGTRLYVVGTANDIIIEYEVLDAWDKGSLSHLQSLSVASEDDSPHGLYFRSDGLRMFMVGYGNDTVRDYALSSAWDVSTASLNASFSVASQDTEPNGLWFKPDGTKMYVLGRTNDRIYEYDVP